MENNINFDTSRYFQLLKKRKFLIEQGEFLNHEDEDEFLSYSIILENQIYYNRKDEYIDLVAKYLNTKKSEIAAQFLVADFNTIFNNDNKALDLLIEEILQEGPQILDTFSIHPKSEDFSDLVQAIFGCCELLTFDKENHTGITLEQFHDSLEKLFVQIQEYSDVGNSTLEFSKDFSKVLLVKRSYQIFFSILAASGLLLVNLF
jgi:hypothetical protein